MMEDGRGSSIPRVKGVAKNGNTWIPLTPDKSFLQSSINDQSEMKQNQMGDENWHNLMDIYGEVLRNNQCHNFNLNGEGLDYGEGKHEGVPQAENCSRLQQYSQYVAPVEVYCGVPLNSDPNGFTGVNNVEHSNQNLSKLNKFGILNQNAGIIGSYTSNVGEVSSSQGVGLSAELMSIIHARCACPPEGSQVAYASVGERIQQSHVLHGSKQVDYAKVGAEFQQSHNSYENHDGGGYSQQEIPKSKPSVAKDTLNRTLRSEARESSSVSRSSPLGPVTPDQQNQSKTHHILQVPHFFIEDASTSKKYIHGSILLPSESEILEKDHGGTSANSISTSSTAGSSTSPLDMRCSDGGNGGIDLNKTPQQKTPKRVKHRPKVVVEGKPKRSPKPASTKRNTHDGNCPSKRKYVRKNGTKNSNPPTADTLNVIEASDMGAATKSCKRKLNFDMETGADNRAEKEGQGRQPVQPDNQEQNNECHKLSLDSNEPSLSAAGAGYCDAYNKERRQSPMAYNSVHSVIRSPLESCNGNNLNAIARDSSMRNASLHQSIKESQHNQVHYHSNGSHPLLVFQAYPYEQNLGFRELSSVQTTHGALEDRMDTTNKKASSRACKHTVIGSPQTIQLMGSQLCPYGVTDWQIGSEKFDKIIDKLHGTSFSMDSDLTTCEESIQQTENRSKSFMGQNSTEPQNGESRDSVLHKFQQQYASSQVHPPTKILLPKTFQNSVDTQITKSMTADINWNLGSASNRDPLSIPINRNINYPRHVVVKNRSARVTSYKKAPGVDQVIQIEPNNKRSRGISSKEVAGIKLVSVDDIMDGMKNLRINNSGKELVWKEQSALVSYRRDGVVIPHEGFDIVKKRLPRPRVDLDPETNRLWNLLMGNDGDGSAEKMDPHKEKWWEEERKVFRGRVDSFIARMHLVQGDRRFSKWKGSVVDSVIGVFLTQNVSDHLSSSAFMSLAAKFPSKSTAAGEPCCGDGRSRTVRNHDVRITYPDGTTFHQKMVMEPVNSNSLVTSAEKAKHCTDNVLPEKGTSQTNDHTRRTVDDIISSQNSSESFVLHASEDVRSSSGSNSDAECGWTISKNVGQVSVTQQAKRIDELLENTFQIKEISCTTKNLIDHQKCETQEYVQSPGWANIANVQHHQNSVPPFTDSCSNLALGMQIWEEDGISILGRESISTLTSKYSKETGARNMDDYRGQSAESASEDGWSEFQTSAVNHAVPKGGLELQNDFINESDRSSQHLIKNMSEKLNPFHQEDTLLRDPRRPSNAFSKQSTEPSEIQKPTEVVTDKGQRQSSEKLSSEISVSTPIARKRKAEKEKVETCNWDTLRKQVYLKTGKTERSREAVDSLDYEALHNADVHEVSDTIKERGMNNKLAERMKNFLNRLVEDHEEIDLEWLRDVEPDKAKDYLLSVQGLGLKSVECVRLLTLHHLAFPVDTNVGRIAVRLGWVPLQPLPESLQLHLLELYPILESIQKYLWPRLCKLDQETLYELHYQMITFGKVFCTKRDPNCNACPMRGECRHFASAFASARFSLPGPQERHIVSSAAPMCGNKSSDMKIKPMPLLPSGDTMEQGVRLSNDCEPVIEEPKTPEPPAEVEERDIEDAFYEEPDEIPVIKLNIEEFTSNIQSLIQEKIDIGEEMSKALVALNPGFASIPTTKLKHVSRLRTEHQVYELPDSHPLLQGMDRREPDDPSPYLLAIWTPGETADSFQAPESRCRSMEGGGLCNNETCFSCNSRREAEAQTVRGTILIPCRTATRGSFPLNGTYFQVNEVFADHESSLNPIDVPRNILWNLPRRTVFFGSSVTSIFKGLSTEEIQFCFWKGFVCVRGFDQKTRAPRPLKARLHLPASKMAKRNEEL